MVSISLLRLSSLIIILGLVTLGAFAQSIRFESTDGVLKVNGNVLHIDDIPVDMNLQKSHFSVQMMGAFPMRVSINGMHYEIWKDRITKSTHMDDVHFRILIDQDGTLMAVESSDAGDVLGLTDMMSDQIENFVSTATELGTIGTLNDPTALMDFGQGSLQQQVKRVLELSNYFTHVRDANRELFELLRDEWSRELEAIEMARSIHHLEPGIEREEAIEELEEKLDEIFSMKQANRQMEIQRIEVELNRLQDRLRERSEAKKRLIDARLSELLGHTRTP